jgi:DNA-binding FadR family transcriptional regulator
MTDNTDKTIGTTLTDTQEANVQQLVEAGNQMSIANAAVMSSFDAIKMLGQMEAMQFIATVAEKSQVEIFLHFKEGRKYKGLPYKRADGSTATVADLEEFCQVFLRKSNRRLQELVSNYNTIGADLYEQSERLGFRQRDYNALKALPADDRAIIAEAIEAEDLDKALDLMQQMAAKHHREKETTSKQLDELTKSVEAKDSVIKGKSEELDKKNEQLARLQLEKTSKVDEVAMPGEYQLSRLQEYARDLTVRVTATLNSEIVKLYNEFGGQPPKHIELAARQAVGLVITAAYGVAENMGFEPITEPELADDEPGKADAEAFMAYQAAQTEA